jgi:hypothetical protein
MNIHDLLPGGTAYSKSSTGRDKVLPHGNGLTSPSDSGTVTNNLRVYAARPVTIRPGSVTTRPGSVPQLIFGADGHGLTGSGWNRVEGR